jgi:hypothetical protein
MRFSRALPYSKKTLVVMNKGRCSGGNACRLMNVARRWKQLQKEIVKNEIQKSFRACQRDLWHERRTDRGFLVVSQRLSMPTAQYAKGTGRDHNAYGFTMWMADGGIKGGMSYGETDELGAVAVTNRLHVKNLHATDF